jgi:hypothetical protein
MSSEYEVTEEGERILRCLQSVIGGGGGQAEVVACVQVSRESSRRRQESAKTVLIVWFRPVPQEQPHDSSN